MISNDVIIEKIREVLISRGYVGATTENAQQVFMNMLNNACVREFFDMAVKDVMGEAKEVVYPTYSTNVVCPKCGNHLSTMDLVLLDEILEEKLHRLKCGSPLYNRVKKLREQLPCCNPDPVKLSTLEALDKVPQYLNLYGCELGGSQTDLVRDCVLKAVSRAKTESCALQATSEIK